MSGVREGGGDAFGDVRVGSGEEAAAKQRARRTKRHARRARGPLELIRVYARDHGAAFCDVCDEGDRPGTGSRMAVWRAFMCGHPAGALCGEHANQWLHSAESLGMTEQDPFSERTPAPEDPKHPPLREQRRIRERERVSALGRLSSTVQLRLPVQAQGRYVA